MPQVPVEGTRAGDGKLMIGTILPQTGSLAFLGPPEFAGFDLAIQEINAAGGVLGKPIVGHQGRLGRRHDRHRQPDGRPPALENVDAIIGAASSGVSLTVIDKITGAGVVQFSPANTSKTLSTYPTRACTSARLRPTSCRAQCSARSSPTTATTPWPSSSATTRTAPACRKTSRRRSTDAGVQGRRREGLRREGRHVRRRGRRDQGGRPGRRSLSSASTRRRRSWPPWWKRASGPRRPRPSTASTATWATPLGDNFDAGK